MNNTASISLNNNTTSNLTLAQENNVRNLTTSEIILVAIYVVIFILGLLGNLLVVHYFGVKNKVRRLYHIYLIHLAVADLISSSISSSYFVLSVVSGRTWYLGEFPCKLISLIGPLTVNVSAWLLVSIAYERYRGIISPFKARLSKWRIHLTVASIWLFSFLLLIPYALSIHLIDGWCRMQWSSPHYELAYAVGTLFLQSVLPIIYMKYTVNRILYVIRNRMTPTSAKSSKYSACSRETSFMSNSFRVYSAKSLADETEGGGGNKCFDNEQSRRQEENELSIYDQRRGGSCASDLNKLARSSHTLSVPSLNAPLGSSKEKRLQDLLMPPVTRSNNLQATSQPILETHSVELPRKHYNLSQQHLATALSPEHIFATNSLLDIEERRGSTLTPLKDNIDTFQRRTYTSTDAIQRAMSYRRRKNASVYHRLCKIFGNNERKDDKSNPIRQQQRIAMLVVTFSVFVICSLPYNVFYVVAIIVYDFIKDHSQLELLQNINLWLSTLVLSNSIMNCFIYAGMDRGFKTYCKQLLKCNSFTRRAGRGDRLPSARTLKMEREIRKIS